MSQQLNYEDIKNIIYGATLLGGGGGGSLDFGVAMLDAYADTHGGSDNIFVEMCEPSEMAAGTYAAVTAGMGAPTAIPGDFSPWVANAFNFFSYVQEFSNRQVSYSMAVELGGFNTFVPMLVSLVNNIPFLNVDGSARAVPALTTLLFNVNGYNTLPIVLADYIQGSTDFSKVLLDFPNDAANAALAETAARDYIADEMNQIAGLCGWMTAAEEFDPAKLPIGSIDTARQVGSILRTEPAGDVFTEMQSFLECQELSPGDNIVVYDGYTGSGDAFDKGWVLFDTGTSVGYKFDFQNESLVLSSGNINDPDNMTPIMTAPDIICAFAIDKPNKPMTNSDWFDSSGTIITGTPVKLGKIKVNKVWWYRPFADVNAIWQTYFSSIGYTGDIIPY